jgi:hypothetical protein
MNFNDPMPYSYFSGRRDGSAPHIKHLCGWMELVAQEPAMAQDYLNDERYAEAKEEERAREYLRQPLCHDDKDYR